MAKADMKAKAELKVGELARRTGLTVRTLHHYDEIGLLPPGRRSEVGHRIYGDAEVRRLQRITALRQLGLSLDEIRDCLDRPEYGLEQILSMQQERIRRQMARHAALLETISGLLDQMRRRGTPDLEDVTELIRMTTEYGRYYTPEQITKMRARAEEIGKERMREAGAEWSRLFAAFERAMQDGLDPESHEVGMLMTSYDALIREFTGGDPGVLASLRSLYRDQGGPAVTGRHGMTTSPELWEYIGRARAAAHR